MIRVLGAALIGGCGVWFGEHQARKLRQRVQVLEGLKTSLEQTGRELEMRRTPLPQLFRGLSDSAPRPVKELFSGCAEALEQERAGGMPGIWASLVEELPCLEQEERQLLVGLGHVLGRYPGEEQGQALFGVCRELERCIQIAREENSRMGKVYRAVGAAGGGFLIILLL